MAAKKKAYKPLTKKEKEWNKEWKKQLVEEGIISPPKAKLNRKKFAKEVKASFKENVHTYDDIQYIMEAMMWLLPSENINKVSQEQVGVLKLLKLTVELKQYMKAKKAEGEQNYKALELYNEVVKPIIEL